MQSPTEYSINALISGPLLTSMPQMISKACPAGVLWIVALMSGHSTMTVGLAAVKIDEVATRDMAEDMEYDVREGDEVGNCDFSKGVVAVIAVSAGLDNVRASLR